MSLNREMLQVARLAPRQLGDATPLVVEFLQGLANQDGGYADRSGQSDLYYSSFAVSALVALQQPLPAEQLSRYLAQLQDRPDMDLVELASLVRIWSLLPRLDRQPLDDSLVAQTIEGFRAADGGYNTLRHSATSTLYGCFLAVGVREDLGLPLVARDEILPCIHRLQQDDGGFANGPELPLGLTTATAAAAVLLRHLGQAADRRHSEWLLSRIHPEGGFVAAVDVPMPDLLSTATALHALTSMNIHLGPLKPLCLDFLDTLWNARGGFHGNWEDDHLDSEYTYYGLLSLGHLSI